MKEEKEIIAGYTVQVSLWIGGKRLIYGRSENPEEKNPYMKCIYTENGLLGAYSDALCSDRYEEIMQLFADDIKAEALSLEAEKRTRGEAIAPCLPANDLAPVPSDMRIIGQIVAIDPAGLADGYRDLSNQLYYVKGGFGAEASSRGRACYCTDLYSRETCRIERQDILGIVPEEKLPAFARETLAKCLESRTKNGREGR